jgi:hypothetical protein
MTHEQILKSHREYGDMSGIGYNKTKIKEKRWGKKRYEKEMKRLEMKSFLTSCATSAT